VQLAAIGLALAILVGAAGALLSNRIAENQSVHEVARTADLLADSVIQPELTDTLNATPAAVTALDAVVRERVLSDSLIRVKLWQPDGLILYSDEPRLIGKRFSLDDEARRSLSTPQTQAGVSELARPENAFERSQGTLLEVYRPVWTPDGHELLFETYFKYGLVSERTSQLWHGFLGITLSAVAMLFVLFVPLVAALWSKARRAQAERHALTRRALLASQDERRRVAAGLHDGPVQELAAASFALAGAAKTATARNEAESAVALRDAAEVVRSAMTSLRSVSVELYPPSLQAAGLTAALTDLAASVTERGLPVQLELDPEAIDGLDADQQQGVFRISRECLQNAVKHSAARHAWVWLHQEGAGPGRIVLRVGDDGAGFEPSGLVPDHLGLAMLSDLAIQLGAGLQLCTAPGAGTEWRVTL
jgi:two-component system NarL family sensor kinase